MRFDLYIHFDPIQVVNDDVEAKLDQILTEVRALKGVSTAMTQQLTDLQAVVTETKTVADSMEVLMNGLADQLAAIKDDPAAIQAMADDLRIKNAEWAAAVVAHTPAAPPPVEPPA